MKIYLKSYYYALTQESETVVETWIPARALTDGNRLCIIHEHEDNILCEISRELFYELIKCTLIKLGIKNESS